MGARILQISDIHLFADTSNALLGVKTQDSFQAVRDKIQQQENAAQLILLSGDLAQDNSEAAYIRLAEMLKPLRVPAYYIPGNHDDPKLMAQIFPRENILNDKHILLENWQIILLNSQKPGAVEGFYFNNYVLCKTVQKFPNHHAVVVSSSVLWVANTDNLWLTNAEEFWQIVSRYANAACCSAMCIRNIVSGAKYKSIPPLPVFNLCVIKSFWFGKLPPGYRWVDLHDNGTTQSGVARVPHYVGTSEKTPRVVGLLNEGMLSHRC